MRMLSAIHKLVFITILFCTVGVTLAAPLAAQEKPISIDRIHLVTDQINLLKSRYQQSQHELAELQSQQENLISSHVIDQASKSLLDKASLDISVVKSNLDSINIELVDSRQTVNWLEKNIQEIQNQLNVLNMFGSKMISSDIGNVEELRADLTYQQKLLRLEKSRSILLQDLQNDVSNILQLRNEKFNRLSDLLKSRRMLHIKQHQVRDELAYQELQNDWLLRLNVLYGKLNKVDPIRAKNAYAALEREIYYANESASFAYAQSLIARYKDQVQQMKLIALRNSSISLLNEMTNHYQALSKQINRLEIVLKSRMKTLHKHVVYLSQKRKDDEQFSAYLKGLSELEAQYKNSDQTLLQLKENLSDFRKVLEKALQTELSARQGLPSFSIKMLVDLGKEALLLPTLAFQVVKSLMANSIHSFQAASIFSWYFFVVIETVFILCCLSVRKLLTRIISRPSQWREKINFKWLGLQSLNRNFIDLASLVNLVVVFYFFKIPSANYLFIIYLSFVWFTCKSILIVSRICLVESTQIASQHDVKLYHRLLWIVWTGGLITALTVFVHQLPLVYELSALCDRLFLFFLMIVSLMLLRWWEILPNIILTHMGSPHPYFEKCIRLFGILIPLLMFANSLIGLFGFLNLVMTVIWYEGLFLLVLIGYLILRALLAEGMQQLSQLMVSYVHNGWLWTEAFLKPLDKILRISLFVTAWVILFVLYGWDKQSPIVAQLTNILNYQLIHMLKTTITPLSIIELMVAVSIFYWCAKWTREFVYRLLIPRTKDMGIRNSIAVLSQYTIIFLGIFICLRVLGIDLSALVAIASLFAFGIGFGLRDLANNFVCGFLILLERPLRVGDIVSINGVEGDVIQIGSRAVTVRTWDHMELLVPNAEIFNKSFTNWTARDNVIRTIVSITISRHDNPHEVKVIIQNVLAQSKDVLKDPMPEVFLKEMNETVMDFELRYFVNIRQVTSRVSVMSSVLMSVWDAFAQHGIKPPYPQHEIFLRNDHPHVRFLEEKKS